MYDASWCATWLPCLVDTTLLVVSVQDESDSEDDSDESEEEEEVCMCGG